MPRGSGHRRQQIPSLMIKINHWIVQQKDRRHADHLGLIYLFNGWVCASTCACVYSCMNCVCAHVWVCMRACVFTSVCFYVYVYLCMYVCAYKCVYAHMWVCVHVCAYVGIHMAIHMQQHMRGNQRTTFCESLIPSCLIWGRISLESVSVLYSWTFSQSSSASLLALRVLGWHTQATKSSFWSEFQG